jgi:hypothetical protein
MSARPKEELSPKATREGYGPIPVQPECTIITHTVLS